MGATRTDLQLFELIRRQRRSLERVHCAFDLENERQSSLNGCAVLILASP